MTKLTELIPANSLELVKYSGKDLIDRLGNDIISNVVLSILCGDNVRNLTEGLTQRRVLLLNASLFITYLNALKSIDNFTENLSEIVSSELKLRLSDAEKSYLKWFVRLTGKSVQNVVRGKRKNSKIEQSQYEKYLTALDKTLSKVNEEVSNIYGGMEITATNDGMRYLLRWPDLLRCMMAIGAQTLSIRGSEKSMYGKLFEKFVMGSVLSILGFEYINEKTPRNNYVFWLSYRKGKNAKKENREIDATAILKPGAGIKFDIGFIGKGNSEVSLDKVSRFERELERDGCKSNTITIILIDTIGERSRVESMARAIGGYIIQMSGTYWVYELAETIKKEFPFYKNPILNLTKEQSLEYIKTKMVNINLQQYLSIPTE